MDSGASAAPDAPPPGRGATRGLQRRLWGVFGALVVLVLGLACALFYARARAMDVDHLQEVLRVHAALAAREIDGDVHASIRSRDDPAYAVLHRELVQSRAANPQVRDIYTMARDPDGTWRFIVDAEEPGSEIFSDVGTPYDATQDPALVRALDGPVASDDLYTDEYGTWLSGYAPLRAHDGRVVGIVGVDIAATEYREEQLVLLGITVVVFLVGVGLSAVAVRWLAGRIADPIVVEESLREAAHRALQADRDRAIELARAKSEFLSLVSHELRTPLTGVVGMVELLGGSALTPAQRDQVRVIERSGRLLLTLIDDLLDYARDGANRIEIASVPYALESVLRQVVDLLEPRARAKGVELRLELGADVPPALLGDATRVQQVLLNLVGNAVKFTSRGTVVLRVGVEGGRLAVDVTDTGIGLSPEVIPTLFQPFEQGDPSVGRRFGGTGLGLYISRRLVERMGGEIGVTSTPGEGSTFRVRLPLHPAPAPAAPTAATPQGRVLLADDNPIHRQVLLALLDGVEVDEVGDGEAAVAAAARTPYALVLLNLRMPGMDGYDAARAVRALPGYAEARLVAITADSPESVLARCREAGFDAVLPKPYRRESIAAAVGQPA